MMEATAIGKAFGMFVIIVVEDRDFKMKMNEVVYHLAKVYNGMPHVRSTTFHRSKRRREED